MIIDMDPERIALHLWAVTPGIVSLELNGALPQPGGRPASELYEETLVFAGLPYLTVAPEAIPPPSRASPSHRPRATVPAQPDIPEPPPRPRPAGHPRATASPPPSPASPSHCQAGHP
jgi:hypothetical protein